MQDQWGGRWRAELSRHGNAEGAPANPYQLMSMLLINGLPSRVTAVTAVATYRSADELQRAVVMRELAPNEPVLAGTAAVVIGREFLVPDPSEASDDDLLRRAVDAASDSDFAAVERRTGVGSGSSWLTAPTLIRTRSRPPSPRCRTLLPTSSALYAGAASSSSRSSRCA